MSDNVAQLPTAAGMVTDTDIERIFQCPECLELVHGGPMSTESAKKIKNHIARLGCVSHKDAERP